MVPDQNPNGLGGVSAVRTILHVDMDAFFASVEQRDDPALRGKPVLVGGVGRRGVVTAASYEARAFGCHSAQPMAEACRLCPQAIVVPTRGGRYAEVSRAVFEILEAFTPVVEPLSIDEAFLDVTGARRCLGTGEEIAIAIRARIKNDLDLAASVGVAPNKFIAKLASDACKPDGLLVIEHDGVREWLEHRPIRTMWGIGPVGARRMEDIGVNTFGDLARVDRHILRGRFGSWGERIADLALGHDVRRVTPDVRAHQISHERTFGRNLRDPDAIRFEVLALADAVSRRLRKRSAHTRQLTLKIRNGDFKTVTRSTTFSTPTARGDLIGDGARDLIDRWIAGRFEPVRLVGVSAKVCAETVIQHGLFEEVESERRTRLDEATDELSERFGKAAIRRATSIKQKDSKSGDRRPSSNDARRP